MPREIRQENDLPDAVKQRRIKERARKQALEQIKTANTVAQLKTALLAILRIS